MNALVLGGSGLVGTELVLQLRSDSSFTAVTALGRVELAAPLPPTLHCDVVFCCLGTTIKVAGSEDAFREVDQRLPIRIARAALEKGAQHFIIVSAMGADATSRIFYNRVKGEMEAELRTIGYPHVTIVHPSLLLGDRKEKRIGEKIASVLMRVFSPLIPKKWQAVHVRDVARVMVESAKNPHPGVRVINNDEIVAA
ncbi:MAG: NAD(P)H-binding protein [Ignavibacteria bacterium]|nr:NAD(P)H-binding protein [Ignavibacteria bacterium]MBK7411489.1 NAD(P)H-binding protein [Ignavibacteria bacterium]MBL0323392.1 NAD(P)H-binding protein [Ignavibacteria bacterium]